MLRCTQRLVPCLIDAPISVKRPDFMVCGFIRKGRIRDQISRGEESFEAADDLGFGFAFGAATSHVGLGGFVMLHPHDDGAVEGSVGLAVTAPLWTPAPIFSCVDDIAPSSGMGSKRSIRSTGPRPPPGVVGDPVEHDESIDYLCQAAERTLPLG